jgi:ubiquinone/menaquinone biosynthesis C-methylase UbiE
MHENKHINRNPEVSTKIFDNRSLSVDYRTLVPLIKEGMTVLDVGCGTGAISKDIANLVGNTGKVIGIDNTDKFIESGQISYKSVKNLKLIYCDLFAFEPDQKFDLIVSARMLQWLSNPKGALLKMQSMLKDEGQISVLDYNHNDIEWNPEPPESMKAFYNIFLKWRRDAGMNNGMSDILPKLFEEIGLTSIEILNSDEHYARSRADFISKVGIWSKVAGSKQLVDEGYLDDELRQQAIREYDAWVEHEAISMTMKLNEVRGKMPKYE